MKRMSLFLRTTFLGGFVVLLPVALTVFLLKWLVGLVTEVIEPLTQLFTEHTHLGHALALSTALVVVLSICFLLGLVVKTSLGAGVVRYFEQRILKVAPGYSFFKETVQQLFGQKNRSFSRVVLVRMFGSNQYSTGFVTNEHQASGLYTVFVPSGLNPTSGYLLHSPKEALVFVDVQVETAMRTIIGCGTGASQLLDAQMPQGALNQNR